VVSLVAWSTLRDTVSIVSSAGIAVVTLSVAVLVLQAKRKPIALIAAAGLCVGLGMNLGEASIVFPPTLAGLVILGRILASGVSADEAAGGSELTVESRESISDPLPSLDRAVARELGRARRYERPATVASLSIGSILERTFLRSKRDLARVAHIAAAHLRETDVLGYATSGRLVFLLPETDEKEAKAVFDRLGDSLAFAAQTPPALGLATFPDDGVTWEKLEELARKRERRLGRPARFGGLRQADAGSDLAETKEPASAPKTSR
jgi:hypothetical protein